MAKRYGKCSNIGNCNIADQKKEVEILDGQDFNCSECGNSLYPVASGGIEGSSSNTLKKRLLIGIPLLLILISGLWWCNKPSDKPLILSQPDTTKVNDDVSKPEPKPESEPK
jgi:phosphate transport system substrate-binding protein